MSDDTQFEQPAIAIVGMAGRFPGAENPDELWTLLREGKEGATDFNVNELHGSESSSLIDSPSYVRRRGVVAHAEDFDAGFFGVRPLEARVMDPQQRVFLEICHEALESAGCVPESFSGSIGVYATASENSFVERCLGGDPQLREAAGPVAVRIGNDIDYLASGVAYRLNLSGPAITVRTACSSSLVAIINGCRSLHEFECDAVLAGGVSISAPQNTGYLHQPGSILSPDGHCRTFDQNAKGTYFSNGAAVVLLKRFEDAIADGDNVLAKIVGFAVNNDGANRASFTSPNVMGQAEVIAMAQEMGEVDPSSISYIEAHGTATEVGDPIEVEALTMAFRRKTQETQFCGIGSIKSNLGHLDVAAGVAGLVKVVLAMSHRYLPPTINYERPNPKIDFTQSPFKVVERGHEWIGNDGPLRAGVSAFGTGGTNAHVILEEAPSLQGAVNQDTRHERLLLFSAKSESALPNVARNLAETLDQLPAAGLADVEYTLRERRSHYDYRGFVVCDSCRNGGIAIRERSAKLFGTRQVLSPDRSVALMFPGQGTQYPGMGKGLYEFQDIYRRTVDECLSHLAGKVDDSFRQVFLGNAADSSETIEAMTNTSFAQPAIFILEYALAKVWMDRGLAPDALIGHSVGEFVAACLSGVMSLDDALSLVALRGKLMANQPPGSMLSVRASHKDIYERLPGDLSIACINGPAMLVVSGPDDSIREFMGSLEGEEIPNRLLHTSHAFHSSMMQPVVEEMRSAVGAVELKPALTPIMSTVTGQWLNESEYSNPDYWAEHAVRTVNFSGGFTSLTRENINLFVECGSRTTLATLARQHQGLAEGNLVAVSSLGEDMTPDGERKSFVRAIGELWSCGLDVDTTLQAADASNRRVTVLPTYPFERQRLWPNDNTPAADTIPALDIPQHGLSTEPGHGERTVATQTRISRIDLLKEKILETISETFGSDFSGVDPSATFIELGFDSLFLTQVSGRLSKVTGVEISFRQMLDDYPSAIELARYMDSVLPESEFQPVADTAEPGPGQHVAADAIPPTPQTSAVATLPGEPDSLDRLLQGQLEIMRQQLDLARSLGAAESPSQAVESTPATCTASAVGHGSRPPAGGPPEPGGAAKPFGPMARIGRSSDDKLTDKQMEFISALTDRYVAMTATSKTLTQASRKALADPRTVSGFNPLWKEMVYPLITVESRGSKLTDVDGNELIDVTNGFGTILFGHSPDFVVEAITAQIAKGYETGPQSMLAGEAASLVSELTGHERVAFANTGSEAVLAAMRMARTCTGRDKIVVFAGSYHGIFDEVVSRGTEAGGIRRTLPAAPGIPAASLENIIVLEYRSEESLRYIEAEADHIAAVMTEPVQGGNPSILPGDFLRKLREVTTSVGVPLIFDEVVTGFRVHPGGVQGLLGIQADIATYGKVCGGGMPIGVVAGRKQYMDALDGGYWQYGDDSRPEANMTFFAGTFVRHPLALAACVAVLTELKRQGPEFQKALNEKMARLADQLNGLFQETHLPMSLLSFSSFGRLDVTGDMPFVGLLYYLLRERGIHIWEGRAVILTSAHDGADIQKIVAAFREGIAALQAVGLLPTGESQDDEDAGERLSTPIPLKTALRTPPSAGARLGRTAEGHPAWFVEDPDATGSYLQLGDVLKDG